MRVIPRIKLRLSGSRGTAPGAHVGRATLTLAAMVELVSDGGTFGNSERQDAHRHRGGFRHGDVEHHSTRIVTSADQ
jgi:hypothetical protein